jgi:5'-3' exonuclease
MCGAHWDPIEDFCYGYRYLIVYNFFRNLRPIIEQFTPDKCFVVAEGHPSWRYDLLASYKHSRIVKRASNQEGVDKFNFAHKEITKLLNYLPITMARAADYEADDTIGTLAENMKDEDLTILSSDQDYIQLLQRGYSNCQVYNPIKKIFLEAPDYNFILFRSLTGDKSDDIPGILKPKKALEAVTNPAAFKTFMDVEENRVKFNISKRLVEFAKVPEAEIVFQEGIRNFDALREEFETMKFQSITNDISWQKYVETFDCLRF